MEKGNGNLFRNDCVIKRKRKGKAFYHMNYYKPKKRKGQCADAAIDSSNHLVFHLRKNL